MIRDIQPDTLIDERYRIISRVGSGGMADVYCAEDLQLGRNVALKLLHRRFAEDEDFVERFRREASSAAGLQHPNVVGVYDRGEWSGTYYIAMEFLEGQTLKQIVRDEAPLDPVRAVDLTLQILKAAQFAHKRGIVHRDLKPHNVIVDGEGRVKVTDFGIARAGASDMTETGSIMGTAQYLSPEQAQGHAVSAASDLYAIGVVLYELLTGAVPFDGDSAVAIALKHVSEEPQSPSLLNPMVPSELAALVLRALAKNTADRFASAAEFGRALEQVRLQLTAHGQTQVTSEFAATDLEAPDLTTEFAGNGVKGDAAYDNEVYYQPEPTARRRWPWVAVLVVVLLVGVAALAYFLTRPADHTVPDVVGRDLATASAVLQNAGFEVQVQRVVTDAPQDRVVRQDPQPGSPAEKESAVTLTVSEGPGNATVPDVEGLSAKSAQRRLRDAGFKIRIKSVNSSTIDEGKAVRTSPPTGVQIEKKTEVTLFLSSGPQQVTVPDLRGDSQDSAESQLRDLGLKIDVSETESKEDPKTVLNQNPAPDSEVDKGSTVAVVVSKENKEVEVPSVTGDSIGTATSTLSGLDLTVVFVDEEVSDAAEDGIVLRQRPSAGQKVEKSSKVTLTVGRLKTPTTTTPATTTS